MATLWIVHREPETRGVLARLVGDPGAIAGAPADARFEGAEAPEVVMLGLCADFEQELEFAHRFSDRWREASWMLLAPRGEGAEARRLFDMLPGTVLGWPTSGAALRRTLGALRRHHRVAPLSQRRRRDQLSLRFARWFADLDIPPLFRALDPRLADVALLLRGERGTGRSLLARYVHAFGARPPGLFVMLPCAEETRALELLETVTRAEAMPGGDLDGPLTLCLEEVHRLAGIEQRRLSQWVELGLPDGVTRRGRVRWIATTADPEDPEAPGLDPRFEAALAGVALRLPPLRERPDALRPFVETTVSAWCSAHGERPRALSRDAWEVLGAHPWPGNLAELEAVLVRSLACDGIDPLTATRLRFDASGTPVVEGPGLGEPAGPAAPDAPPGPGPPPEPGVGPPPPEPPAEAPRASSTPSEAAEDIASDLFGEPPEAEILPEDEEIEEALEPLETDEEEAELWPLEAEPEPSPSSSAAAPAPPEGVTAAEAAPGEASEPVRRLAAALATALRKPVESLTRMAEILPAHAQDPAYQMRFHEQVELDAGQLASLVDRLDRLASLGDPVPRGVNLAELLDELLEERRATIERRRLLVLKELDREAPEAWADPAHLRFALGTLLDRALSEIPERGDLYLSSKRHPSGLAGGPSMRVLLRFEGPSEPRVGPLAESLELTLARGLVGTLGGRLTVDRSVADETLVLFDLPAPR